MGVELTVGSSGPGPRGTLATLSQYMLSSAATFGFFMSIGSVRLPLHSDHASCVAPRLYPVPVDRADVL